MHCFLQVSCGVDASSSAWERDRQSDFFRELRNHGHPPVVPSDSSLSSPESLLGKRVGVPAENEPVKSPFEKHQPEAICGFCEGP